MIPNIIRIRRLHQDAKTPVKGSDEAAGYDLYSLVNMEIPAQERRALDTGVAFAIPPGHYGKIESRSGMAFRDGIIAIAGVIDADYRDAIKVVLLNTGFNTMRIEKGDRIAQIIFLKHESPELIEVNELDQTERGHGGFGSTGR